MLTLEPPDSHYLLAAIGWIELGNLIEAKADLAKITPRLQQHAEVLGVHWHLASQAQNWDDALAIAESRVKAAPDQTTGWIWRAYSLRRAKHGSLEAAWDALIPAVDRFPAEPIIPYNLACYAAQLGRLQESWKWLNRAITLGNTSEIKKMALVDADLRPLGDRLLAL